MGKILKFPVPRKLPEAEEQEKEGAEQTADAFVPAPASGRVIVFAERAAQLRRGEPR